MKEFYSKNKKIFNIAIVIIFSIGFFSVANVCWAGTIDGVVGAVLGAIASIIVELCGWFLNKTIAIVIDVASYNDFINNPQIKYAWVVIRDLCNMFFILILLIIAFATILRIENYNVKKLLPKLLIMAVLINFSRTICGLFIDFSQVIMLTFVNAFKDGGGNFVAYLNVDKFLQLVDEETKWWGESGMSLTDIVVSYIAAILFMIIATITMLAILIVFVMRMIMLWIYVVLSPLAFLLSAFPAGQKYAGQYWGEFTKYLINGPVLAFFIWLSLITLGSFDVAKLATTFQEAKVKGFSAENYMHFILAIGMLVGGLMVSQQIGGIGASWGASAVGNLKTRGLGIIKGAAKLPFKGAKELAIFGIDKASQKAKIDFNVFRGWKRLEEKFKENKGVRAQKIEQKVIDSARQGGRLSLISHGALAWDNIRSWRGMKRLARGKGTFTGLGVGKFNKQYMQAKKDREKIWSEEEGRDYNKQVKGKQNRIDDIEKEKNSLNRENSMTIGTPEFEKRKQLEKEQASLTSEIETLGKGRMPVDDIKAKELNDNMEKYQKLDKYYELKGAAIAEATANAEIEGTQAKKISNIEDAEQLGRIIVEALKEGNQGLVAAAFKKTTRLSDYNEAMRILGIKKGTGEEGMHELADKFQKEGGMTEQAALGLVAEIGGIAKNINHFGAFGAVTMENGRWRKSQGDEAQMAQLAEMLKLQPQNFARNVNRLGLGYYKGEKQSTDNWEMSKAAIAYLKLNSDALANQYKSTGQQNALEHLASSINQLLKNDIKPDSLLVKIIQNRALGTGADVEQVIKSIKK